MKPKLTLLIASLALLLGSLQPAAVMARDGDSSGPGSGDQVTTSHDDDEVENEVESPEVQEQTENEVEHTRRRNSQIESRHRGKLAGLRLEHCQARQDRINEIIDKFGQQGTKHLGVFDTIANRVMDFATSKNLKPDNYDALVDDINAKRAAAAAAVDVVSNTQFVCDSDAPLGRLMAFKQTVKDMRSSLHAYRTSIKNLIVAIKAKAEAQEKTDEQ